MTGARCRFLLPGTGVVGFYGASSMEPLPVETAIADTARRFKQLTFTPR